MKIKDFSYLEVQGLAAQFLEIRIDYDGGADPVYVGYNPTANAGEASDTWFIVKLSYSGGNLVRQQLGNKGRTFSYSWTDRATYFS